MKIKQETLLQDAKNSIRRQIDPDGAAEDSLALLFRYFAHEFQRGEESELENSAFAKRIYAQLGWEPDGRYDVISSFYTSFQYALAYAEAPRGSTEYRFVKDDGGNDRLQYKTRYGFCYIGKEKHAEKIIDKENICSRYVRAFAETELGKRFEELAGYCHCAANFMPCPDGYDAGKKSYNQLKGILPEVRDYFPLMIDKIQKCVDENSGLEYYDSNLKEWAEISLDTVKSWQCWFIGSREKYCLQCYYYIEDREGVKRILGIPFFKRQSPEHPTPQNQEELSECLDEMLMRIKTRAYLLALNADSETRQEALAVSGESVPERETEENPAVEEEMYRRAVSLIEKRYPSGWGGAAVVHTAKGNYFTSVSIDTANASAVLCIETGAILEAHKYNERVTHCLCLMREDENSPYKILTPCGICQERLRYWGEEVQVAVTAEDGGKLFVPLKELQPYHWTKAYKACELERFEEELE